MHAAIDATGGKGGIVRARQEVENARLVEGIAAVW